MLNRLLCCVTIATFATLPATAFAEDGVPEFVTNKTLVVARVGNSNQFAAYSKRTGEWTVHTFQKSVRAVPITGSHLIAFALKGESVAELAAVDANGKWHVHKLGDDQATDCIPFIDANIAIYKIGSTAYGFSGTLGAWDSIQTQATPVFPHSLEDSAMIVESDKISVFSELSGKWSTSPDLSRTK